MSKLGEFSVVLFAYVGESRIIIFPLSIQWWVTLAGITCDFDKKGVVIEAKRECWSMVVHHGRCVIVDEYIENEMEYQ